MIQPAALPPVLVELDGRPLPASMLQTLSALCVRQRLSLPTQCELSFTDPPVAAIGSSPVGVGRELRILVAGIREPLFVGQVTAIETVFEPTHGRQVLVRGYDKLHQLRKRQSLQRHTHVTAADLARTLVEGVTVQLHNRGPEIRWPLLLQRGQSDFDLLVEVTASSGLYLMLQDTVLHLVALDGTGDHVPLVFGESLHEARIEVNAETVCQTVAVEGWSPLDAQGRMGRASSAQIGREVGVSIEPSAVGASDVLLLLDQLAMSEEHAQALAQSERDRRAAQEVTLWAVAEGNPRLRPGTAVDVQGAADGLTGTYVVTSAIHTVDTASGYLSEISTTPPEPLVRQPSTVATLGTITHVNDPESRGRVKASLPAYHELETEWMEVLTAGAGADKGLVVLPSVGDTVLMLLVRGEPGAGIVLGGLYGSQAVPDSATQEDTVKRYSLQTPGGQRVALDDAHRTIRLEDASGNYLEMGPEGIHIHATTPLVIEAPGKSIVIQGGSVDFNEAKEAKIEG